MTFVERADLRGQAVTVQQDDANPRLRRATISIHDQYVREAGMWVPAVEDFVADGQNGYALKAAARLRHQFRLANDGSRMWFPRNGVTGEFVTLGRPAGWNGSAWQTPNIGAPVRVSNRLTWDTANWGMGLTLTWRQTKLDLIVKATNVSKVRWPVTLTGITRQGGRLIGGDGATVARLEAPIAWDANGSRRTPNVPITWDIVAGTVEFSWNPVGVGYPLTIDPTFTSQPDATAGDDGGAAEDFPDATQGTATVVDVRGSLGSRRLVFVKFDLSSIPGGAPVTSATLSLWSNAHVDIGGNVTVEARRLLVANSGRVEGSSWNYANPSTVRWAGDTGGNGGSDAGGSVAVTDYSATLMGSLVVGASQAADVENQWTLTTATVEAMLAANHGFEMGSLDITLSDIITCDMSDFATAGQRPKLVIVYTAASGQPPRSMHQFRQRMPS